MKTPSVKIAVPAVAGALVALAGCADPDRDPAAGVSPDEQLYETVATVLESPDHGPQLCHAVQDSLPPQCGGPDIVGWDWDAVQAESHGGTTWGQYHLVGAWDGERFHLAESARPAGPEDLERVFTHQQRTSFDTPCPEPEGGWQPVDPATTTDSDLYEAIELAGTLPGYAGSWLDQSYLDEYDDDTDDPLEREQRANDPTRSVLNLRFTGNLDEREQEIRAVWGGALCLSDAEHTEQQLRDIQQQVHEDLPDVRSSGVDPLANAVTAQVLVATPELQADLDARYGPGTVILDGLLKPV